MDALETIFQRHSYRGKYRPVPVPEEDLITIMKAGLAAPSGCNRQTTSLIAVNDPAVLERLHSVIEPDIAETAPAAICVVTHRINAYRDRCFAVQDYSAAIENILLAVTALGYQSCWYEGHITDEDRINEKMAEILGIPKEYELVCFLPVGIGEEEPVQVQKKPFAERAFFNAFGESEPERIPPKSMTQILLDNLGIHFNLPDQYGENRLLKASKKIRYAIEISRALHMDTDITAAILFAEEFARIDHGLMIAGSLKEDPSLTRRIAKAKSLLSEILEETDSVKKQEIMECLDRLVTRSGESSEERLAYLLIDAQVAADMIDDSTERAGFMREYKNRILCESRQLNRLAEVEIPSVSDPRKKVY